MAITANATASSSMFRGINHSTAAVVRPAAGLLSARHQSTTGGALRKQLDQQRREQIDAVAAQGPIFTPYRDVEPSHVLHVQSTRNNVIMSYTDFKTGNKVMRTVTGGTDKDFKKSNRSSYEAAHQAALKMFAAIKENTGKAVNTRMVVAFKGMFGQGREAVSAALLGPEGSDIRRLVVRVEDRTPIKIGGTRAKRPRRL
ncbi:hypothetical protein QFC21_002059 [Naganishia friedmannii]|uniref:Uncharacterized protein n=1 Tax=Naganishia friedmannii TaxID=89922 RepID=A0ACC2W126_9TREE|nr:hypothetical protein QFC21_002059 [Naganishia friedmannii]